MVKSSSGANSGRISQKQIRYSPTFSVTNIHDVIIACVFAVWKSMEDLQSKQRKMVICFSDLSCS